jgi:hypothetical protein
MTDAQTVQHVLTEHHIPTAPQSLRRILRNPSPRKYQWLDDHADYKLRGNCVDVDYLELIHKLSLGGGVTPTPMAWGREGRVRNNWGRGRSSATRLQVSQQYVYWGWVVGPNNLEEKGAGTIQRLLMDTVGHYPSPGPAGIMCW